MNIPEDGYLLRIFIGESDRHGHHPRYEAIVLKARETGLAGATVVRGVMGFGKHSVLHTAKILRLSEDLPMVVEVADSLEKIEQFLPALDQMITDGLVTSTSHSLQSIIRARCFRDPGNRSLSLRGQNHSTYHRVNQ